ncbi:hypothetical protein RclHR1_00790003 [Rhizophagus clarus]|uniref:Uncharacterized protein n=1 Tax=Rhizophagus clarus TaxID=94130 RepID=A0A2Z6S567_9GLOM|nr:hypothetical protein RclHR1_00790003 [Rhizophagus clarus]GES90658.1 hypothetical protein RCL_jg14241.t1 [Rhizophagus clarus]
MKFYRNGQILRAKKSSVAENLSELFVSRRDLSRRKSDSLIIDLAIKRGAELIDDFGNSLEALLIEATNNHQ